MERSTTDVVGGALLAENAGAALEEIEQVSNQIASLVQNISASARQQAWHLENFQEHASVAKYRPRPRRLDGDVHIHRETRRPLGSAPKVGGRLPFAGLRRRHHHGCAPPRRFRGAAAPSLPDPVALSNSGRLRKASGVGA